MKVLLLTLLLCATPAFANDKPPYSYQNGVLQNSHRDQSGEHCAAGECADQYNIVYTVESGGAIYILTPRGDSDPCKCGLLRRATIPHSVLANLRPHTPIQLRSDGKHFFVRIGNRESEYSVARVE